MIRKHLAVSIALASMLSLVAVGFAYAAITPDGKVTACVTPEGFVQSATNKDECPKQTTAVLLDKSSPTPTPTPTPPASVAPIDWQPLPLLGPHDGISFPEPYGEGWQDPQYGKDVQGIVHLSGRVKWDSHFGQEAFRFGVLPDGFRPEGDEMFTTPCGSEVSGDEFTDNGKIFIRSDGEVQAELPSDCRSHQSEWVSISGITFPAA